MKNIASLSLLLAALGTVACGASTSEQPPATADSAANEPAPDSAANLVDTAVSAGSFSTLVAAVKAAGLEETLAGPGPFTVFAPTDDAFAKLPAGTVESLLEPENKAKLVAILTYHVVPGKLMSEDVVGSSKLKTVQGQELTVRAEGTNVSIDSAKIVKTDVTASNGVIHVLDAVVLPPG